MHANNFCKIAKCANATACIRMVNARGKQKSSTIAEENKFPRAKLKFPQKNSVNLFYNYKENRAT